MAEKMIANTLGSLGRIMGGSDGRKLDATMERLQQQMDAFADNFEKLNGVLGTLGKPGSSPGASGFTSGGMSSTVGNAGGPVFGGFRERGEDAAPGVHRSTGGAHASDTAKVGGNWSIGGSSGTRKTGDPERPELAANGGDPTFGGTSGSSGSSGGSPTSHSNGGGTSWGKAAKVGAGMAVGALALNAADHNADMYTGQTVAAEFSLGQDWKPTYDSMLLNNSTAMSTADSFAGDATLMANSGFTATSPEYQKMQTGMRGLSISDPSMSNQEAATAVAAIRQPASFNKLQMWGIDTVDSRGNTDIKAIANQILQKIPDSKNIKTKEQLAAALWDPAGNIYVTLQSWLANGLIPQQSFKAVQTQIKDILLAQIGGASYTEYSHALDSAASDKSSEETKDAANKQLEGWGIKNSLLASDKAEAGQVRNKESEEIVAFTATTKAANSALSDFHDMLTGILKIPGLGELVGGSSGIMGKLGSAVSMGASLVPGGIGVMLGAKALGVGGSAPTMSRGGYSTSNSSSIAGRGVGGSAPTQSRPSGNDPSGNNKPGNKTGNSPSGGNDGNAGVTFIAPRPGIDSMSSEMDYGPRVTGQGFHTGIDLQGPEGASIKASAGGTVTGAGVGAGYGDPGYGSVVMIDHGGGFSTMYAHMLSFAVSKGDTVRQGQGIGAVGNTGSYSQGAHLHFELWINGQDVDPVPYLNGKKAKIDPEQGANSGSGSGPGNSGSKSTGTGTGSTMGSTGSFSNGSRYGSIEEIAALGLAGGIAAISIGGMTSASSSTSQSDPQRSGTTSSTGTKGNPDWSGVTGGGSVTQNQALGKQMAAKMGWTGSQWKDLLTLWTNESGWSTTADNSSSSAYGIPQALVSAHLDSLPKGYYDRYTGSPNDESFHGYGGDPKAQIGWGLNYIKDRYGDPSSAWDFWQANGNYERGAWNVDRTKEATVHKGEMILTASEASKVRDELTAPGSTGNRGGGKVTLVFQKDSIQFSGFTGTRDQAEKAARVFVDTIKDDARMVALMEGR